MAHANTTGAQAQRFGVGFWVSPRVVVPAVHLLAAMAVLFTSSLQDLRFARVLFAVCVLVIAGVTAASAVLVGSKKAAAGHADRVDSRGTAQGEQNCQTQGENAGQFAIFVHAGLGVAAGVAALVLPADPLIFALVVAGWLAGTCALQLFAFLRGARAQKQAGQAVKMRQTGGLAGFAACLALVLHHNPVAVVGVFGAYAIIAGIFGLIGAFDVLVQEKKTAEVA
ncbi:MAG: hypothetical protein Q4C71_00305 [Microbacteriaceae bacterium]|nr:hypothetical protein [Microbacteriaceae bacterium]